MATMAAQRRAFGNLRKLPSGRWQVRYTGPDGVKYPAPFTFDTKTDAGAYLSGVQTDMLRGTWKSPDQRGAETAARSTTLTDYANDWLRHRDRLRPRTRTHYRSLLDHHILPVLGAKTLANITPTAVRDWHRHLDTGPTMRAHAYALLKSILAEAVTDDILSANPCRIRGAGTSERVKDIRPATLDELARITMGMPDRLRLIIPLTTFCSLRFGEVTELRRRDVDLDNLTLTVSRGVVRDQGEIITGRPKTRAGVREVAIPPHLAPMIAGHLATHAQPGSDGLLFYGVQTGVQLAPSSLRRAFKAACTEVGRPDLTPHVLRHTGATLAGQSGATTRELQARLGHTTAAMAMRYQHVAEGRDLAIAERMSAMIDPPKPSES